MRAAGKFPKLYLAFIEALKTSVSVTAACEQTGVSRTNVYALHKNNPAFRAAMDGAYDAGTDRLEDEATKRAVLGTSRPIFQGGKRVGEVQEYSDRLLEVMLRGRRPDKFKDRPPVDASKAAGLGALGAINIGSLTDAQLDTLINRLEAAGRTDGGAGGAGTPPPVDHK